MLKHTSQVLELSSIRALTLSEESGQDQTGATCVENNCAVTRTDLRRHIPRYVYTDTARVKANERQCTCRVSSSKTNV